jgi:hypothetical protein
LLPSAKADQIQVKRVVLRCVSKAELESPLSAAARDMPLDALGIATCNGKEECQVFLVGRNFLRFWDGGDCNAGAAPGTIESSLVTVVYDCVKNEPLTVTEKDASMNDFFSVDDTEKIMTLTCR